MGTRRAFAAQSTGEQVATRDRHGQLTFPSYGAFNDMVQAAWHGETYVDDRGREYQGDAFLDVLRSARWVFDDEGR